LKPSHALFAGLAALLACPSWALDYRSTGRAAILYDAPSATATKLAVAGIGVPFEVFVDTADWVKVRDHTGRLAWIEKSALGGKRSVMVMVDEALVKQQPQDQAETLFRAIRGVLLETQGETNAGWLKVRHADGLQGWLRQFEVWGE
jgi:SH3-like domain-containing protein